METTRCRGVAEAGVGAGGGAEVGAVVDWAGTFVPRRARESVRAAGVCGTGRASGWGRGGRGGAGPDGVSPDAAKMGLGAMGGGAGPGAGVTAAGWCSKT